MVTQAPPRTRRPGSGWPGPPQLLARDGGGDSGWAKLTRTVNEIEAQLVVGRLSGSGIETHTIKDRSVPGAWLVASNTSVPVTILVRRFQLEDARMVLMEVAYEGPAALPGRPDLASRRNRAVLWWVGAVALGLLFTGLGLLQAEKDLRDCERAGICVRESARP